MLLTDVVSRVCVFAILSVDFSFELTLFSVILSPVSCEAAQLSAATFSLAIQSWCDCVLLVGKSAKLSFENYQPREWDGFSLLQINGTNLMVVFDFPFATIVMCACCLLLCNLLQCVITLY